ncbi:MAG: PAS domain S-box protein [Methanomicrobiales archaeon]
MILDQEKIARIKNLLKFKPKGMSISDISHNLKMNRNSVAKYLDLLLVSGQVEMRSYGTAKIYFLSHRVPLSAMLSFSSDLVVIVDSDFRIIQVNENFNQAFHMTRESLIGTPLPDVPLPFIGELPLDHAIKESTDKSEISLNIRYESPATEDSIAQEMFYRVKLIPTVFEEGARGITIILENITETKAYEHQLEVSEARYRNIVEDQTEFISRFLPNGTHLFVNEAYLRYFGKQREEILNSVFIPEIPPEDRPMVRAHFASLTPDHPVHSINHRIIMPDGSVCWQRWSDRAIFDENGQVIEYQSVGRDITDMILAEKKTFEYIKGLEILSRRITELVDITSKDDIFRRIGEGAMELIPRSVVVVHSYEESTGLFLAREVLDDNARGQIKALVGRDPVGMNYPISERPRNKLLSGKLVKIDTSLYEAINHLFSAEECSQLEKKFNLSGIYVIGLARKEKLLGRISLLMMGGATPPRMDIFETYIRESSIALQKQLAEEALIDHEEQFQKIVDYSPFPISIVESSGSIIYINKRFTDVFGYTKEELPTISDWQALAYPDENVREEIEATRLRWLYSSAIGEVTQIRASVKSKEGLFREIEIRAVSMSGARQFITYEDITDRLDVEKIRAIHKSIVESSDEAIIGKSPDGTIISWNNGAERMYGYSSGEIIGASISLLIPEENQDNFIRVLERVRLGEHIDNHEAAWKKKDGSEIDIALTLSPIRNDESKIIGVSSISRDISRQKKDERELLIKGYAIESSVNGIVITGMDGNVTYANRSFMRMFGYASPDEVIGQPIEHFAHEDLFELKIFDEVKKTLGKKGSWIGEIHPKRRDGTRLDAQLSATLVRDTSGNPICMMAMFSDISTRVRAEHELFLKENAISAAMNAITILDLAGNVIYANKAFVDIMGYHSLDDVIYHPIEHFTHGDTSILAELQNVRTESYTQDGYKGEVRLKDRDGKETYAELTVRRIADNSDKTLYIILSFVNITELKELRNKLNATDRELSDIIEFLPDPTFVIDQLHHVIAWNRAIEDFTGVNRETIIGTDRYADVLIQKTGMEPLLVDLLDLPGDEINKKYPDVAILGTNLIHESGVSVENAPRSSRYLEKASPLLDTEGMRNGAIMTIRDITPLKMFEESLHKAHGVSGDIAKLQMDEMTFLHDNLVKENDQLKFINSDQAFYINAINASLDLIIVLDSSSKIRKLNNAMAALIGMKGENEVTGRHISTIIAPEYRKIVLDFISDTEKESNSLIRYSLITSEGRLTVEASVSEIHGEKSGYVLVQRVQDRGKKLK